MKNSGLSSIPIKGAGKSLLATLFYDRWNWLIRGVMGDILNIITLQTGLNFLRSPFHTIFMRGHSLTPVDGYIARRYL